MSILHETEIVKQLGRGILIHPIKEDSIRSCNICLTAGKYAYSITTEQQLVIQNDKYFLIPAGSTALIWTDEAIYLNDNFCGTIHSTVSFVSQGLGHLGTRINPSWSGVLCIPFHNLSSKDIKIYIQDLEHPIAYIMVHKLISRSFVQGNIDCGARLDVLDGLSNTQEIINFFYKRENIWMMGNKDALERKMKDRENTIYFKLKDNWFKRLNKYILDDAQNFIAIATALLTYLSGVLSSSKYYWLAIPSKLFIMFIAPILVLYLVIAIIYKIRK